MGKDLSNPHIVLPIETMEHIAKPGYLSALQMRTGEQAEYTIARLREQNSSLLSARESFPDQLSQLLQRLSTYRDDITATLQAVEAAVEAEIAAGRRENEQTLYVPEPALQTEVGKMMRSGQVRELVKCCTGAAEALAPLEQAITSLPRLRIEVDPSLLEKVSDSVDPAKADIVVKGGGKPRRFLGTAKGVVVGRPQRVGKVRKFPKVRHLLGLLAVIAAFLTARYTAQVECSVPCPACEPQIVTQCTVPDDQLVLVANHTSSAEGKYSGQMSGTERYGIGTFSTAKGDKFSGYWEHDELHGWGSVQYSNGTYYDGRWVNGTIDGVGRMTVDGDVYYGEFRSGQLSGPGCAFYSNGAYFLGYWAAGQRSGKGLEYEDSEVYYGNFARGARDGQGFAAPLHGRVFKGLWENGETKGLSDDFYTQRREKHQWEDDFHGDWHHKRPPKHKHWENFH